ncbi:hypothetical protein [Haloimpatiens massiliensis]|uniref:hypothetical protein n=1 Tax=Haloimpatiens massiliensis TaxID=1658110 RepID=UPI000C85C46C|nr:hypothetical protein [Haloimpatiens massiliensis]
MTKKYESLSMVKKSRFIKLFDCCDEKIKKEMLGKIDNLIKESSYTDKKNTDIYVIFFSHSILLYTSAKRKIKGR